MNNDTTTERPKGAPEFDPSLPCDTRDPGRFRRILCTDRNNETHPICYEADKGRICCVRKDGLTLEYRNSLNDLVNVWPVLREGWTCEFIPADTEPIREGERFVHEIHDGRWIVRNNNYEMEAPEDEIEEFHFARLRLIPPAEEGTVKESEDADKWRIKELEEALDRISKASPERINGAIVEWMQQVAAEALGRD